MKDDTQTTGQAMKALAAVEGVLRRRSQHLLDLARSGLLATDLRGYQNLREQFSASMAELLYVLKAQGVPDDVLSAYDDTVPVLDSKLWDLAMPVEPPESIVMGVKALFPEWSSDFAAMVSESRTTVNVASMDPDARDGAEILRDLDLRGHGKVLQAEVTEDLKRVVERVIRMAAMYDLYMDLRVRSMRLTGLSGLREKLEHINPLWAMLGLGVAEAATSAALGAIQSAVSKPKRKTVAELAKMISEAEGQ